MTELIKYLENKIENCEALCLPKEKWAFIQTLKKVRELQQSCITDVIASAFSDAELENMINYWLDHYTANGDSHYIIQKIGKLEKYTGIK